MKKINRKKFLADLGFIGTAAVLTPSVMASSTNGMSSRANAMTGKTREKRIRVGIIGCGSVSNHYLAHLSKSPYAELVSVCDIKPERARKRAEEHGLANWYPHIDNMLEGVPFDLLVNLTDMQEHGRLNRIAVAARKHVWSEKPLANTYPEGKELLDLAREKGCRIWGAPVVVNSPQFAFMARQVRQGKLGRIAAATAHYGHTGPDWSAFFYEEKGGSLPDLGVYNLTTMTGLFGPVKSLVAMTNIITPIRDTSDKGTIQVEAEDNAQVIMEHEGGVLSHIQCSFNYYDPYGHGGTGQELPTIIVLGTEGNMRLIGYDWMPFGVDMTTTSDEKTRRYSTDRGSYVWEEGASLACECLSTGKELPFTAEHSLHVVEIIEATRESQRTGKRIELISGFKTTLI
jgi:predicted dehydrogenase